MRRLFPGSGDAAPGPFLRAFWFSVWLAFLAYPASDVVGGRLHGGKAVLAVASLAVFVVLFEVIIWRVPWGSARPVRDPGSLGLLAVFAALTAAMAFGFGSSWIGTFIYLSVLLATVLPVRPAVIGLVANSGVTLAAGLVAHVGASNVAFFPFMTLMIGMMVVGWRRMTVLVAELREAQEEVARLAVGEERLRFARDLHDLLGHSLSLIVLKSELARRLLDRGEPEAAGREVREIESVGRQALVEVREAVTGYRTQSLTAELDQARSVLSAAGIEPVVRLPLQPVGGAAEAILGWAVREGVTNVVRHSGARHCEIAVVTGAGEASVEIRDDGVGPGAVPGAGAGSGLRGLEERLALAGGRIEAGQAPGRGFRLFASVPVGPEAAPVVAPEPARQ